MSQFSKKLYLSRRFDDPLALQKGHSKKKGYIPHVTTQPKLNFTSNLRTLTPTGGKKSVAFPGSTTQQNNENTLLIQDLYSNTTKANLLKNDRASKENEKKESYKSLKIDLASLADKENEQVDDEELELFHFQKLEEEIIGNKGVDRIKTEQDQNYKKEKNSQGIKHVKVFQSRDREPLFQDVKWKSYTNVSGDKSDNSIIIDKDEKSHIESKALDRSPLISNTNFHNSSLNSLYSTQNINTNIHRTKIDLTFDTAPPKQKSRSNSVLMNRNIKDQVLNQGVTTQMRSNSNISKNDISMTTNEISNKIKPSSLLIPLQKMITPNIPSPINSSGSNASFIPPWNRSGPRKERKRHTSYRSNSQVSDVSPLIKNYASVSVYKETINNKVESANIKVIARFRPLNKMEMDFMDNGMGAECVAFPDAKSVMTFPDSTVWTFDAVFQASSKQEEIYDFIGKETIDDVLSGYNGTIFAYGQTSSGKTYTMFGDMHEDGLQGIIPRASNHLFDFIRKVDDDVEFVIKCSMLEIYKETLYDLLNNRANDLKIKENPQKGVYVAGLTEISVCSEEEMLAVLEVGERSRSVAATHLNQYSSRSHTLFTIEIIQRYANQSEKRGKLNLVDLAGSEKVGKSGAVGETLEEAKKINLSLSCLGNVIHSLTQNAEHIPFRDSKLTRILQESIGGNYKTALIVTCSPHSFNKEETTSTLKFATRAKTIKTHYKINIQNSPESLTQIIEKLRAELEAAKIQIATLKSVEMQTEGLETQITQYSRRKETEVSPFKDLLSVQTEGDIKGSNSQTRLKDRKSQVSSFNSNGGGGLSTGFKTIIENNLQLSTVSSPPMMDKIQSNIEVQKDIEIESERKLNAELFNKNEMLEIKVSELQSELENAKLVIREKDNLIHRQAKEIITFKNTITELETKLSKFDEGKQLSILKMNKQHDIQENLSIKAQVLEKQVHALTDALLNCEQSIEALLMEKSKLVNQKFEELVKEKLTFRDVRLTEYFTSDPSFHNKSIDEKKKSVEENLASQRSSQGQTLRKEDFFNQINLRSSFRPTSEKLKGIMEVPYSISALLNKDLYGNSVQKSTMNDQISPELMTYILRQQLIQCLIVNKHLERVIAALEWKQMIQYGKANIKLSEANMQENYIKNLEQVLDKSFVSYQKLRTRLNSMEVDLETQINHVDMRKMPYINSSKAKVLRPFTRDSARKKPIQKKLEFCLSPSMKNDNQVFSSYTIVDKIKTKGSNTQPFGTITEEKEELNCNKIDEIYQFLGDIEKDFKVSNGNPNTIEEAKIMLSLKTIIIEKMKEFIKSFTNENCTPGNQISNLQICSSNTENLQNEIDRLCDQMGVIQSELELEKAQNIQMKEAYMDAKNQINHYSKLIEEMELSSRSALRQENETWQKVIEELIVNNKREILRKQEEVKKLHDQLAGWIYKFLDLQDKKVPISPNKDPLTLESYKRRETSDYHGREKTQPTILTLSASKSVSKLESTENTLAGTMTPPALNKKF